MASLGQAQELVQNNSDAQVIIARGGTAAHLKDSVGKTIVHITASCSDLLVPVGKLNKLGFTDIGVVVRSNVLEEVIQDINLNFFKVILRPCESDDEIRHTIQELAKTGVKGIVTDKVGAKVAQQYGIAVEFLDSGIASITKSICEAVKILQAQEQALMREQERARQILQQVTGIYTALEQAAAAIEQLSASSQQLAASSEEVANNAKDAKEKINSIANILEIIRHVARQTNLLGLNAAIEAAPARAVADLQLLPMKRGS
ncbi:hypothetical protein SPACI_024800 [Sporomusa acidovorans DSM 3132]|uniref:Methyl-accepting transducer domain-containing protein n=1 Tax=Sporomusa acidovorans (strain ATCC 49682 / DSM 3132 / Mol) TaxID=1123286 RepID=A0ABZ3J220_SPOA4|nr:propionate catabolism activator [Sporomusa acidovorans DSM 3132]SDF63559.1 Methyl-accepting chemotaxis protein (MCP) signalling domain-containing protein [Sporomusa acidovorans]